MVYPPIAGNLTNITAACDALADCRGFNQRGFIKRAVVPVFVSLNDCTYTKQDQGEVEMRRGSIWERQT